MYPKVFLAVYECVQCGEEYEMQNCAVPYFFAPCDECGDRKKFKAQKVIHQSFEWDAVVED